MAETFAYSEARCLSTSETIRKPLVGSLTWLAVAAEAGAAAWCIRNVIRNVCPSGEDVQNLLCMVFLIGRGLGTNFCGWEEARLNVVNPSFRAPAPLCHELLKREMPLPHEPQRPRNVT
jgi:hypothetical protein